MDTTKNAVKAQTVELEYNIHCQETMGQGHDKLTGSYLVLRGKQQGGEEVIDKGSLDIGEVNNKGGSKEQDRTGHITNVTVFPDTHYWIVFNLNAKSDWILGKVLDQVLHVADYIAKDYTGGFAGFIGDLVVGVNTDEGSVGTIVSHIVFDAKGHAAIVDTQEHAANGGSASWRGGDFNNNFGTYDFLAGNRRADYFVGLGCRRQ